MEEMGNSFSKQEKVSAGISKPLNENWKSVDWYFEQIKQIEQTKGEMLYLMFNEKKGSCIAFHI